LQKNKSTAAVRAATVPQFNFSALNHSPAKPEEKPSTRSSKSNAGTARIIVLMMPRIRRATRIANLASAVLTLRDPLPDRVATSVITNDLINRKNGLPAGGVTDNATRAMIAIVRLRG
jgi:hypothetical protein